MEEAKEMESVKNDYIIEYICWLRNEKLMMTLSSVTFAAEKIIFAIRLIKSEMLEQDNDVLFLSHYS